MSGHTSPSVSRAPLIVTFEMKSQRAPTVSHVRRLFGHVHLVLDFTDCNRMVAVCAWKAAALSSPNFKWSARDARHGAGPSPYVFLIAHMSSLAATVGLKRLRGAYWLRDNVFQHMHGSGLANASRCTGYTQAPCPGGLKTPNASPDSSSRHLPNIAHSGAQTERSE